MGLNVCLLVTSACCTSIPTSFSRKAPVGNIDTSLLSALTSCKPSKVSWKVQTFEKQSKENFVYKNVSCFHDPWVGAWISMHFGDKHQQEKLPCMLYYCTLHSFSREPRNIEISYLKTAPRIVKMFVNIKHYVCVTATCLHINSK